MDRQLFQLFQETVILQGSLEMATSTSHRLGCKETTLQFPTPETEEEEEGGESFSLPDLPYLLEQDKKTPSKVNITKAQVARKSRSEQIL